MTDPHAHRRHQILIVWLLLTLFATALDAPLAAWFQDGFAEHVLKPILTFTEFMGGYPIHLLVLAIVCSSADGGLQRGVQYAVLMLGSTVVCTILKYLIGRARPDELLGPFHFQPLTPPTHGMNSFPSGDATAAMAMATLLGIYFPKGRWFFWVLGGWTALARVARVRHYLSDVVFGAGLGILFVLWGHALLTRPSKGSTS